MKKGSNYSLGPNQLARLLCVGLQATGGRKSENPTRAAARVLKDMLSAELPLDASQPDSLPTVLNWPSDQVFAAAGRSMSDLLLDSGTALAVFKTLKDYAKALVRREGPRGEQAAATVIYYAAIAGALVFHNRRITDHPYEKLHQAYTQLEEKAWIPDEMKDLFKRARALCEQHKPKNITGR